VRRTVLHTRFAGGLGLISLLIVQLPRLVPWVLGVRAGSAGGLRAAPSCRRT
jgi:hypothetical protein